MIEEQLRRSAVERAYRDHADHVYRVAFAILHDSEAASDATHDAFARAYERWEQYDANRPLRAWLHGIVAHAALDAIRRRRVRERTARALGHVSELTEASGAGDPAGDAVRHRVVEEGLATLTPQARAAVVLRHYYGYDYAEIASFLQTSPGNVGSLLSRAHADLRLQLAVGSDADPADSPTEFRIPAAGLSGDRRPDR
ncbi:MAG TPA: sigma-70 family RNA polymerase sigma factor [Candidatus Limnocylindria bacterium]|nr:sigma-70 family RNA polymerase sigma factor [Candidatus Limnocylindria bacterium]